MHNHSEKKSFDDMTIRELEERGNEICRELGVEEFDWDAALKKLARESR